MSNVTKLGVFTHSLSPSRPPNNTLNTQSSAQLVFFTSTHLTSHGKHIRHNRENTEILHTPRGFLANYQGVIVKRAKPEARACTRRRRVSLVVSPRDYGSQTPVVIAARILLHFFLADTSLRLSTVAVVKPSAGETVGFNRPVLMYLQYSVSGVRWRVR